MVPAIGGLARIRTTSKASVASVGMIDLPPSPIAPTIPIPSFPPFVKNYELDPENLRPGVIEDLKIVAAGWELDGAPPPPARDPNLLNVSPASPNGNEHVDVLDLLKTTTHAVRSVRNYLVSLPDESSISGPGPGTPQKGRQRPHTVASPPMLRRVVSHPDSLNDPLTRVRRAALEVLGVLRVLEEAARLPLEHDAYDAQSDHGSSLDAGPSTASGSGSTHSHSRGATPSPNPDNEENEYVEGDGDTSVSIYFVNVGGRQMSVPVWEDGDESFDINNLPDEEKRETWDERLVLGGGWLYKQDIQMKDLEAERAVVAKYLDAVDEVLFSGQQHGKRGWERAKEGPKNRRASSGPGFGLSTDGQQSRRTSQRVVSTGMLDAMRRWLVRS